MNRYNAEQFTVRCTGYTQSNERYFTTGKVYDVCCGTITSDEGYTYHDDSMTFDSDPSKWFLSSWYKFEIVEDESNIIPEHLDISYDDLFQGL